MLQTRVLRSADELVPLIPAWRELELRAEGASIFQTPEWAIGWWRAMQTESALFCVGLFEDERPVGLAPLCIEKRWGMRIVRGMGGDVNDSDGMMCEPSYTAHLERAVLDALGRDRKRWDALRLCVRGQPDGSEIMAGSLVPPEWVTMPIRLTPLPKIQLPTSWNMYWQGITHERRRVWARYRRRLDEQGGMTFRLITDPETIARELPTFLQARYDNWRQRNRWRDLIAFQRKPSFAETLTSICIELAARGHVWLGQLAIGEKTIAWKLLFRMKGTLWSYMTTYAREHRQYNPGIWVALEVIRCAIERGLTRIEMGRGDQPHKFWLGADAGFESNFLIAQRSPGGMAVLAAEWLRERAVDLSQSVR
jgi:CelD/BcsL family acetyltransferase involved in cellulose biosynthesis